jgi:hypothetical protein
MFIVTPASILLDDTDNHEAVGGEALLAPCHFHQRLMHVAG